MANKFPALPERMTIGEMYAPAVKLTTKDEARDYFLRLVEWGVTFHGQTPDQAAEIQKQSLGYYAGYYDSATAKRIWDLFECAHPVFGTKYPAPDEALQAGRDLGNKATV